MEEEKRFTYAGGEVSISAVAIDCLEDLGITIDAAYLNEVWENRSPFWKEGDETRMSILVWKDISNRRLLSEETGLGRVLAYFGDRIRHYESLYEAVLDNWDARPEMGFELLHLNGINPTVNMVSRFGVRVKVRYTDPYLQALNSLVKYIYRYKNGVMGRRGYESYKEQPNAKDLTFEDFIKQSVRSIAFNLGDAIEGANNTEHDKRSKAKDEKRDENRGEEEYRDVLKKLLGRYSVGGNTAFEEVQDLNDYKTTSGVYILGLDAELRYYVGMTEVSLKERILQHFKKETVGFDTFHTFADVSSIHILRVDDKSGYGIDMVEADCIATIGAAYTCNKNAASLRYMEQMLEEAFPDREYAERLIRSNIVESDRYEPELFLLEDSEVKRFAQGAVAAREACDETVVPELTSEEVNDYIVKHRGSMTQREMASELGLTIKAVEHRVARLRKAGRISRV